MNTYKIDWKDNMHGNYEIKASNRTEALEKFKSLSHKEFFNKSKWNSDETEIQIKLIENKDSFHDKVTLDEYQNNGKKLFMNGTQNGSGLKVIFNRQLKHLRYLKSLI